MAKTKYSVTVAYGRAKAQADNIDKIAGRVDQQRIKISEAKNRLSGCWTGTNANTYRAKMGDRENELSRIVSDLRNIARTIRSVAENTYRADMKAVELAQKRKSGSGGGGGGAW